jgi:DAACS family dicarboxylate/amino acid:cation (Na+ or H+) symporter
LWRLLKWLGPLGVASLTFPAALSLGKHIFSLLGWYVGAVVLGLSIQMFVVYSLFLYFLSRRSPARTLSLSTPALLMAFSSSSSNATLPVTLRVATERLGIAPAIARFITTLGATVNQNGTALYEGVTLIFLMQVYGHSPTAGEGALVVVMAMLIAIGAAGVPGGSLPLLAGLLPTFGVPASAIWLIYGIDRLLDMMRTTLNVYGDLVIATYLHRIYASAHNPRSPN